MGTYKEHGAMADFGLIRLDWSVDSSGYDLVEDQKRLYLSGSILDESDESLDETPMPRLKVKARDGKNKPYTARLREKNIFLELATMDKSPDGVLAFVHKWGLLNVGSSGFVEEIISASNLMEHRLNIVKKGGTALAELLRERWTFRLDGEFHNGKVIVRVKNLHGFCWLEFLQAHSAGGDFYQCANPKCGAWRRYPTTGRPNKYCSEACKKAGQRANKKNAALT
jgi:hypothetical protein